MKMLPRFFFKLTSLFPWREQQGPGSAGRRSHGPAVDYRDIGEREAAFKKTPLFTSLEANLRAITELTGSSYDLNIRRCLAGPEKARLAVVFLDGLVNKESIDDLLRIVNLETFKTGIADLDQKGIYETVKTRLITTELREAEDMEDLYDGISLGDTALIFDGTARAILCETRGWSLRAINEPEAETVIRGPREGFIESLRVNTSLIRRRIRSPNLWLESVNIGSLSKTEVVFGYIKGLAGEELLEELRSRLQRIQIDGVLESGLIEEFIRDAPSSLFPTVLRTERPDIVASGLLDGRVAIFTNGTPFVLLVPAELAMFLQAPDDYNEVFPIGSFIRTLRIFSFLLSLFLPGLYVAILNFHPELLPAAMILTVQATREGVPFPVAAEVLIMELAFEILREAGLRLPRAIGPAISIVGALILGEAAIRAGLVSPGVVIVVAFTAIASFSTPVFSLSISARMIRFFIVILGATFGFLGIQVAFLLMLIHLLSLRSFGYPFMAPYGPFIWSDMKDNIIRNFWWKMVKRPRLLGYREPQRQPAGQGPRRPGSGREPKGDRGGGR